MKDLSRNAFDTLSKLYKLNLVQLRHNVAQWLRRAVSGLKGQMLKADCLGVHKAFPLTSHDLLYMP